MVAHTEPGQGRNVKVGVPTDFRARRACWCLIFCLHVTRFVLRHDWFAVRAAVLCCLAVMK